MTDTPELLLAHHLKTLRLPTFLREHDKQARICAAEGVDHVRYLARLTELELIDRERRMEERRIKSAKFPAVKSLDSFDFKAIPSLNKMMVLDLARCDWVERPLVRFDEPMAIEKNMSIVCHPGYMAEKYMSWICDNYIIGEGGPGECIHKYPQKIIEVN